MAAMQIIGQERLPYNMKRDDLSTKALRGLGWHVLRVWETDNPKNPKGVARMIALRVKRRAEHSGQIHNKAKQK
jgi:G:T-mismatch repair DNA endonuclease (very short patch repair protein)